MWQITKIASVHSNVVLLLVQSSTMQSLLELFNSVDLQLICTLL